MRDGPSFLGFGSDPAQNQLKSAYEFDFDNCGLRLDGQHVDLFGSEYFSLAEQEWIEIHSLRGLYNSGDLDGYASYGTEKEELILYPEDFYDWADHFC